MSTWTKRKMRPQKAIKTILSAQYFMCFGIMGIMLPYFNLYCYHLNLSGLEIGTIGATRALLIIVCGLGWSMLADRFQNRRFLYILCQFANAWACLFLLFTQSFSGILCVIILASFFYAPLISFMEAFTMDLIGANKNAYGSIRLWGSIQFIVMVLCVGALLNYFSYRIIIRLMVAGFFIQAFVSLFIPKTKLPKKQPPRPSFTIFKQTHVIIYLLSAFIMLLSHGTYYAFSSIHLEQLGANSNEISIYWALGSIAEILVMLNSTRIFNRFAVESVLIFSFAIATIRWLLMFCTDSVLFAIFTQVFHASTYGAFHIAGILYIDRCMPDNTKTIGQAVNNAVSYGLGMMAGAFINGYLFERIGSHHAFLFSATLAAISGLLLWIVRSHLAKNNLSGMNIAKQKN